MTGKGRENPASPLDRYLPAPDVRERFQTTIRAPAAVVMEVAKSFDLQSPPTVRAIFWLREKLMRSTPTAPRQSQGLLEEMKTLGWGILEDEPDRLIVCGAACQPWKADPGFASIPPDLFEGYAEPAQVKIAWTLQAESVAPAVTRFANETRVVATDEEARLRFRRYWRWARFGIVAIRLLLLPAIRRTAERRWSAAQRGRVGGS